MQISLRGAILLTSGPPIVAVLGGLRLEKGFDLLPQIFRASRELGEVRFRIQMVNETLSPKDFAPVRALAQEPTVTAITEPIGLAEYATAMQTADLGLYPYQVIPYLQRTSAVFSEAFAYGKPTVVTRGTWLAQQVEAGRAAGIICSDRRPEGYARGIAECVARMPGLTKSAEALAAKRRDEVSMKRFIDLVESEIARRELAS